MHSNNLVSKSPFKSQIPTPTASSAKPAPIAISFPVTPTRRVSGEKRQRPSSMHEQAETENSRPFALKRERKQSKALESLLEKEPVTKSPFRAGPLQPNLDTSKPSSLPIPIPKRRQASTPEPDSFLPAPSTSQPSPRPSPGRSVLVSRRMHGPRLSGSGKRERRKTVTFDERCDVVEFDRDEETDEEVFDSSEDEEGSDGSTQEERQIQIPDLPMEHGEAVALDQDDDSYDSVPLDQEDKKDDVLMDLDPETSITGIVEDMFFGVDARSLADGSFASVASTPPRQSSLPPDLETEDGVPLGRSHHVERFLQHQQHHSPLVAQTAPHFSPRNSPRQGSPHIHSPGRYPFNLNLPTHASPHGPPATPPRRSPGMTHATPPLGRSTHAQRVGEAREKEHDETARGVERLPPSPSPVKPPSAHEQKGEGLIPRFSLANGMGLGTTLSNINLTISSGSTASLVEEAIEAKVATDVFAQSRILDEAPPPDDTIQEDLSSNTSITTSEANVSSLCGMDSSRNEVGFPSLDPYGWLKIIAFHSGLGLR